jgi:hypothetical protein
MLQAHSLLWAYLWIGPNVLLLILAFLLWRRGIHKTYPFFFAFAIVSALDQLMLYVADVMPSVAPETWWRIFWVGLVAEGLLKFALIAEIFARVFDSYTAVAKLGKFLIRAVGVSLTLAAVLLAAYASNDSRFGIVSGAHLLEQTIYLIESGLLVFIFVFSGYFSIRMGRPALGISLGLAISACVHLATWAVAANGVLPPTGRTALDFLNMAVFHACVLIWFYYLLVPQKVIVKSVVPLPENNLDLWNRELERLLQ